jgi:hypothetical protein
MLRTSTAVERTTRPPRARSRTARTIKPINKRRFID